jgi:hypothetical protein
VQGTNIAFGQAVCLVVSRGQDVLIDPVLGTVGFHGPAFEGGTFIRNDDIRVPKPRIHLLLKSPDSSLGCDVCYRDKDRVSGKDVHHHEAVAYPAAPGVPLPAFPFLGVGHLQGLTGVAKFKRASIVY